MTALSKMFPIIAAYFMVHLYFLGFKLYSRFTFTCNKKRRDSILVIKSVN